MFEKRLIRFTIVLAFILPFAFLGAAVGQAGGSAFADSDGECVDCHEIVREHWAESAHANALSSPGLQAAWEAEGKPDSCFACHTTGFDPSTGRWATDGVSCTTCHNPAPADHPDKIMPTDVSSRLCGNCHLETYSDWTASTHAREDLACVRCHNPHTNRIRAGDAQALCGACHIEESHFYDLTAHAGAGLLCLDCHLRILPGELGEGHGQREHQFHVEMAVCGDCHREELHLPMPGSAGPPERVLETGVNTEAVAASIQGTPDPVSPVGFTLLAILIGAALGLIVAPWSERWFKRANF